MFITFVHDTKPNKVIYILEKDYKRPLEMEQGFSERALAPLPTSASRTVDLLLSILLVYISWHDLDRGKGSSI